MSKLHAYRQTAVTTASKEQVLIMLYEGAIKHLKRASAFSISKDVSAKGIAVGKAHDIVNELINSLDFKIGGEVARNLESLYNYIIEQLMKGNLENDHKKFDACTKILEDLLEAWKIAVAQVQANRSKG
jgi:flagellar protein FliS